MSLELTSEERMRMWPVLDRFLAGFGANRWWWTMPEAVRVRAAAEDFMLELCVAKGKAVVSWELEVTKDRLGELERYNRELRTDITAKASTVFHQDAELEEKNEQIDQLTDELYAAKEANAALEEEVQTLKKE